MNSKLPIDDTPTFAGNYGLDGFQAFLDYGGGVEDSARLPEARPHAKLPDGIVQAEFDGSPKVDGDFVGEFLNTDHGSDVDPSTEYRNVGDISGFLIEGNTVSGPVDFSWLDAEQDPRRLPESPKDKALKGIQESWGERTDGKTIYRLDYGDLDDLRYKASLNEEPDTSPKLSESDLVKMVQAAMRKSASGMSRDKIISSIRTRLADDIGSSRKIKSSVDEMLKEHGLAGKVFIRAAAYPGCHNGSWKEEVSKYASGARYVLSTQKCAKCIHNHDRNCSVFDKRIVKSIPWKQAFKHYGRLLMACGVKVDSTGDAEADLRRAFKSKPARQARLSDERPVHVPVARVSDKEALVYLSRQEEAKVESVKRGPGRSAKRAQDQISRWAKAGFLTEKELSSLLNGGDPKLAIDKAAKIVSSRIRSRKQDYKGASFKRAQLGSSPDQVRPQDVDHLLVWASRRMSEGVCGKELDSRISGRFPSRVIEAGKERLGLIRSQHEGLSGKAYIHAAAFASGKRDAGCAKGASKLRNSGPKYVLKMDRCNDCVRNHVGSCSLYNKKLISKIPVRDRVAFQKSSIDEANQRKDVANIYQRGSSRIASSSDSIPSLTSNPVDEFFLFGSGADVPDIEFNASAAKPLRDEDISFEGAGTVF